jgi:hypothetical protein
MYNEPQIITDTESKQTLNVAPLFKLLRERFDGQPEGAANSIEKVIRFFILHMDLNAIDSGEGRHFVNSFELLYLIKDTLKAD